MISANVVMELFPKTFDEVVLRRIWRQKMQHDASTEQFEFVSHTQLLVNDVVVEHHMSETGPRWFTQPSPSVDGPFGYER